MKNQIEQEEVKTVTKQILKDMEMKIYIRGFKYWTTALIIVSSNEELEDTNIKMMDLYKEIAKKHKTTSSKVERAMRYVYEELNPQKYFNVTYHINNTAFLFLVYDKVKSLIKNKCYV